VHHISVHRLPFPDLQSNSKAGPAEGSTDEPA
jgi:hypothetical protein